MTIVGGSRMERSLNDFARACEVHLEEEQRKILPDNALIALLCDAVRLTRERTDAPSTISRLLDKCTELEMNVGRITHECERSIAESDSRRIRAEKAEYEAEEWRKLFVAADERAEGLENGQFNNAEHMIKLICEQRDAAVARAEAAEKLLSKLQK